MLNLKCYITIQEVDAQGNFGNKNWAVDFVQELEITSTWREFTDTATITLPRTIQNNVANGVVPFRELIRRWAKYHPQIQVFLGYGTARHLAFKGIIRDVKGRTPVTLECEDDMYFLKKKTMLVSYQKTKLTEVINDFGKIQNSAGQIIQYDVEDMEIGTFISKDPITPVKVLKKLREDLGVYSCIRYDNEGIPVLVVNREYENRPEKLQQQGNFIFYENIIEDELEYKHKEDVAVSVIYKMKGDTDKDVLLGKAPKTDKKLEEVNEDEEIETFEYSYKDPDFAAKVANPIKKNALKIKLTAMAVKRLNTIRYTGFRGSFTTFGDTIFEGKKKEENIGGFVRHGHCIQLIEKDEKYEIFEAHRNSKYYVDGVTYSYGDAGFRQSITLGKIKEPV